MSLKPNLALAILFAGNILGEREREFRESQPAKNFVPSDSKVGRKLTGASRGNKSGHMPHYGKKQANKDLIRMLKNKGAV